ncbi:ankyrin repeat domain-containing protein [Mangrovimonas cancribranchiae]|uniref:Ankyrin repeat domain-containing protein n=1 Tax=Mangrovimonas cancribranchiae TaxID=3080055 RepID=A0AAU6P1N5_9FLAO
MRNSFKIQSKLMVLFIATAITIMSCAKQKESKSNQTNLEVSEVVKPNKDIHEAIISNNLEVVKQHAKAKEDINKIEAMSGSSPLITAVTFNRPKMVEVLVKAGADLSIQNNDGSSALHTAAFFGRVEMVKTLLEAGANKTLKNNFGATPRETVLGDFAQMKPIYEMLTQQLQPMGFTLDLAEVEKARPVVAMMLQ